MKENEIVRGERASRASKLQMKVQRVEQRSPIGRKCDLIITHKATGIELSSSEFAGNLRFFLINAKIFGMVWVNKSLGHNSNKSLDSQDTNVLNCSVNKAIFDRIIDEVPLS